MKIKYFFLFLPIAFVPLSLLTTSCNVLQQTKLKNIGDGYNGFNSYGELKNGSKSFNDLYFGTTNVNKGNYVIFFGASGNSTLKYPDSYNELTISNIYPNQGLSLFDETITLPWTPEECNNVKELSCDSTSIFVKDVKQWKNDIEPEDYKLQFFSLFYSSRTISYANGAPITTDYNSNSKDIDFYCSPFYKWTENDFLNKQYNPNGSSDDIGKDKSEWNKWEKKHEIGTYARNDSEAKKYRDILNFLRKISPQTFVGDVSFESSISATYVKTGRPYSSKTYAGSPSILSDLKETYQTHTYDKLNEIS
ncbi:MAG: hypothetical protein Ta2E_06620 [Mycoplasmoidaceae bacterium]|nr:MAG: hypothetical protein Ta2E_06620 [Mycoplasmoidaceae bacterium]